MRISLTLPSYRAALAAIAVFAISGQAHACELICQLTKTLYTGNLGGLAGADAKCAAEFPNFKFPRSGALAAHGVGPTYGANYSGTSAGYSSGTYAWAGNVTDFYNNGGIGQPADCSGWTATSGITGGALQWASSTYYTATVTTLANCSTALPLACCNM